MNEKDISAAFREFSVLDVTGDDAGQILHNVTTNDVRGLETGQGTETCLTDVRGKVLGHGWMFRLADRFRFIGAAGQSAMLASHIGRYTIREDATPHDRDDEFIVLATEIAGADADGSGQVRVEDDVYVPATFTERFRLHLMETARGGQVSAWPESLVPVTTQRFHDLRVERFFPWYGIDATDANLPQELARDSAAISFTKGCYLGQETVARLDALGQVQKKLVRLVDIDGDPTPGTVIHADAKPVARLTSVHSDRRSALAMVRRAWFEDGLSVRGQAVPPASPIVDASGPIVDASGPIVDASAGNGKSVFAARVATAGDSAAG